jgi:hypothetical protein
MVMVNPATGRDARAVTGSMVEQSWKEGQERVQEDPFLRSTIDADVSYAPTSAIAHTTLTKALLQYRLPPPV